MNELKVYGQVREVPKDVEESRTITFVASDESEDRHGTILKAEKWDVGNYNLNPILGWQHNVYGSGMCSDPDPDQIIGKGRIYFEDRKMMLDATFEDAENNPLAEKVFRKVVNGILNAVSVGFIGHGRRMGVEEYGENPDTEYFERQELLEVSVVSIPSNRNAVKKALRSQTYDALRFIYKELGGKYRFSDIEEMRVKDIIELLEGDEEGNVTATSPIKYKYKFKLKNSDLGSEVD